MGRTSQKKNTSANINKCVKPICQKDYKSYVIKKQMKQGTSLKKLMLYKQQLTQISNQQTFQCPVCLQIYLKPVITTCGHVFCLSCMQDLAKNHYSCGICHNNQPTLEIKVDKTIQQMINLYVKKSSVKERSHYQQRQKQFQSKQADRSVGVLSNGDYVDFWCQEQKIWKSGIVDNINQHGIVSLKEYSKTQKSISINILSRRLARHRYFTKETIIRFNPVMNQAQQPLINNRPQMNLFINEFRPPSNQMIGMPLFFNFYGGFDGNAGIGSSIYNYFRRLGNSFPF